jgi:hypothetical protein
VGPTNPKAKKVTIALPTTIGTKYPDTTSASHWMGARPRWASATIATMRESNVSEPTFSARMASDPVPFAVAPTTRSPASSTTPSGLRRSAGNTCARRDPGDDVKSKRAVTIGSFEREYAETTVFAGQGTIPAAPEGPRACNARLTPAATGARPVLLLR